MTEAFHSVVVVGAGAAGLFAAQLLRARYPDVLVVEAQPRIGGRIKQAGPEFVHGSKSVLVDLMCDTGFKFEEREWPDHWYFGKDRQLMPDEGVDDEVNQVHDWFGEQVGEEAHPPPGQDVSALEWMKGKGASEKMLAVADACYANDFACSLSQLGLREMVEENRRWDSGETYLVADRCMSRLVDSLSTGLVIRTSCPVERIEYGAPEEGVRLFCAGGRTLRANRVIVTIPIKQLQEAKIRFSPALPQPKADAIQRVRMGNVVKIFLTFSRRFWPEKMYDVICTDAFVPEFWMLSYPETAPGQGHPYLITGFIAGERADRLSQMLEGAAVAAFLSQLDEVFGTESDPRPATAALQQSLIYDWSKEAHVGGAYTYPSLGAELGDRELLAAPVSGTVFFAGEHCSLALNPCIQGSLETGQRAAAQVVASLQMTSSKL